MIPSRLGRDPDAPFPDPATALADPDGLLAWGGDLDPRRLERAYRQGIFPWYTAADPILWWSPAQRGVLYTAEVRVPRRLERTLRQRRFRLSCDRAFAAVMAGCAGAREETWIGPDMMRAYAHLHRLGRAHSFEAWDGEQLAGGLYGVAVGGVFCGESMFTAVRDASKVVLASVCRVLSAWGIPLLDCQMLNPHLERLGAREIARTHFLAELARLSDHGRPDGDWGREWDATLAGLGRAG